MKRMFLALMVLSSLSLFAEEEPSEEDKIRVRKKIQEIVVKAKKDWPDNYSLQLSIIDHQTEAMLKMEKISKQIQIPF